MASATLAPAQELIYQEAFNTDGETNNPPRYTTTGRAKFEVPAIQTEIGNFDQKGPIYWAHNFEVSFAGNPNIPARRMMLTWPGVDTSAATPALLELIDSSINWLLNGKTNATIVAHPNTAAIQGLADRLTAAGHTVVDDDLTANPDEQLVPGDLFIHGPGAGNASRFVLLTKPVIVMNALDYDDMLVGSIGAAATFDPGQVTIAAAGHPAAGGKTGSFEAFTQPAQAFNLVGSFLPPTATTLATVTRIVSPGINNLGDLDAVITGTKQNTNTMGTVTSIDFSDASTGQWFDDNALPGGYTGNWGLRVQGKLSVSAPGTYRFALGSDDGARLQIDLNTNGVDAADTLLEDTGPHAHQIVYTNATFSAAGIYDFEVRSYNSGGGGSLELSVSTVQAPVPDDALDSGFWELLGTAGSTSPVTLQGAADVTAFQAVGPDVQTQVPLIVLLNGPTDTPPGVFYDGGPITGFEGTGFFGGAGMNKFETTVSPKTLTLQPVNVAGKQNVKLTIALAATVVDFETSDILNIFAYTNGLTSNPTTLAQFRGVQDAVQPWLADQRESFSRRLTRQFADFTYNIPPGATDLVIKIDALTSWWTEILAIDNIRITAGSGGTSTNTPTVAISRNGGNLEIAFTGTLESTTNLPGGWSAVPGATTNLLVLPPASQTNRVFYRARN
jgi:hypothetical protein